MIRIDITPAAYEALAGTIPPHRLIDAQRSPSGGFYIWLTATTLNKLMAARGRGECYSQAIIRMASQTAEA